MNHIWKKVSEAVESRFNAPYVMFKITKSNFTEWKPIQLA